MNRLYLIILSSLFFMGSAKLFAQNDDLIFERINTSHGLSNNTVKKTLQDSKGYLWIATQDGLNKYDGYSFLTYRNDPQDTTSIINNSVWAIYEDKNGDLWFGSEGGLSKYNRKSERFENYQYKAMPNIPLSARQWANAVLSICETDGKFLWLGTVFNGLIQFNIETREFTPFLPDSTLNNNTVVWAIPDAQDTNKIWYGNGAAYGFGFFNISEQSFNIPSGKEDQSKDGRTFSMFQDSKGKIWIGTEFGGLLRYNPKEKYYVRFKHDPNNPESISTGGIWAIYEDPDKEDIFWIGTQGGLDKLDTKSNSFTHYKSKIQDPSTLSSDFIFNIYKDRAGVMWISTAGGLNKVDPGRVPFHNYKQTPGKNGLNNNIVTSITTSLADKNVVWIGTRGGGLNGLDRGTNIFTHFKHDRQNPHSISSDSVLAVYEDPDEAGEFLWIGTWGGGLNHFDIKNKRFKTYKMDVNDPATLSSNIVRRIYKTRDGALWLSTSSGVSKFDRSKQSFTRYLRQDTTYTDEIQKLLLDLTNRRKPVSSILKVGENANRTQSFTLTSQQDVLIIGMGEGLTTMYDFGWIENAEGKTIWKMDFNKSMHAGGGGKNRLQVGLLSLKPGTYKLHYKSDIGHSYQNWNVLPPEYPNMWGIQLFSIEKKEKNLITQNIHKIKKPNSVASGNVSEILEDSYGMLWMATYDAGLSRLDRKSGLFKNYKSNPKHTSSLSNDQVRALYEDKYGSLWIGTNDGLNKYDPKSDSFKSWRTKDGLPSNSIINILEDVDGNLWLATGNGISKFDPDVETSHGTLTFINYGIQDGLQYNQYFNNSKHRAANGEMFFGGFGGFVSFFPGKTNPLPPRTIISKFLMFNREIHPGEESPLKKHISETKSVDLSYDQNVFSFEFTALHFSRPEKNLYLYKMEGFDKDWIDGHRRFAPYTNLDPGQYTFRVKAANSDGVWNEEGASVKIIISPPWWRTWWAYAGYVLALGLLIFGLDRMQRRKMLAKSKERLKIQEAEHRAEAAELQAQVAEAENKRKSEELEEARQLQLSMLPKELPQLPNLDIAVYMQTATEVGGDYYDFHVGLDGTLTVVIGDATGHGMKAGTMVTATKSLFRTHASNPDILFSFKEITRCIKEMNFGRTSMCLTMLKIKGDKMQMSTAAMPPSFIFRKETSAIEEHLLEGMPLGTMKNFPYKIKDTTLKQGDTILLMSDGLPELLNGKEEMYGYKRIRNGFEDVAEKAPEEIISFLKNEGKAWNNNQAPDDDVTFVVIKVK